MKVVLDSGIAAKAELKSKGLLLGQHLAQQLLVLDLVSFAPGVDEELFCEQVEHMMVGGVSVVGVFARDLADNARQLLWKTVAKRRTRPLVTMMLGATALRLFAFEVGAGWAAKETAVPFTLAKMLPRMVLHSVRLAVRAGVSVAGDVPAGSALERAARLLGERVRAEVVVGALARDKTELWTLRPGPVRVKAEEERKEEKQEGSESAAAASLELAGVVSAFAFVHEECGAEEGAGLLLEDLAASCERRVVAMLDELDALQEEGADPSVEHPLSRLRPALARAGPGLRWTLPRRVLVRGGSVPVVDWAFAWDRRGRETIARCSQVLGMTVEASDLDGSREPLKEGAFLELGGKARAEEEPKKRAAAASKPVSAAQKPSDVLVLVGLAVMVLVTLAVLVWRVTM